MSLWKRVKNLISPPPTPKPERTVFDSVPGDILEVSLVTYEVIGRTYYPARGSVLLTLRDGADIRYLTVDKREHLQYELYSAIDGRLDSFDEVPTTLELDGIDYMLEERFNCRVVTQGSTPFPSGGEQYVWNFQSDNRKQLRVEWQDGRFMLYEGESVLPADIAMLRGT
ncbi:DUF4178 domain-containing protein [Paenibacillus thermoaerophilus]|uniref:DUF4178 domain-containing protein n=1 Tax=Paenibacillus thermoaerophilus TaxID=1215385 RepID=A0ABW2V1F5_9BACL|nr:DUF4178 domain-containing protein [Paenibacillus thermoaerophilus]TMV15988.1 DUF4178 domain-containing protein [Paenibacillus thermoaerophilus]